MENIVFSFMKICIFPSYGFEFMVFFSGARWRISGPNTEKLAERRNVLFWVNLAVKSRKLAELRKLVEKLVNFRKWREKSAIFVTCIVF